MSEYVYNAEKYRNGIYWMKPWTLVSGCTKVSPACDSCWSLELEKRFHRDGAVRFHEERLDIPRSKIPTVFACWNDLHHEEISSKNVMRAYGEMWSRPQHIFLLLTKRPKRMMYSFRDEFAFLSPIKHVYLGTTVESQEYADQRIPLLLQTPAAHRFLSLEPLLDRVSFRWMTGISREHPTGHLDVLKGISWVIVGSESGPKRRPAKIEWVREIVEQCTEINVPVWVKQLEIDGKLVKDVSKFPADLQRRELPWKVQVKTEGL